MFILKKGHQPGVYVPLRALFLVVIRLVISFYIKTYFAVMPQSGIKSLEKENINAANHKYLFCIG